MSPALGLKEALPFSAVFLALSPQFPFCSQLFLSPGVPFTLQHT